MIKGVTTILFCAFLMPITVKVSMADTPTVQKYIQNPEKKGEAHLKFLMWDVYTASLFAPQGSFQNIGPLALKLDYLIDLKGNKISERSIVEMRKQGFNDEKKLSTWEKQMKAIFPNVGKGEGITGIRDDSGKTIFYKNATKIGEVDDAEFSQKFFDIWLGQKTSQPEMRQDLLGLK